MTTTATPAGRLMAEYGVTDATAVAEELQDSAEAMRSWAGRDGRYSHSDTEAILQGHGETFGAWLNHCITQGIGDAYQASELLSWLGY